MMWEFLEILFWLAIGFVGICAVLAFALILAFIIGSIRRWKNDR